MFASLICLKRSVASSTFVGLRSGWYINANLRNAFLWDASSAVSGRPRAFRCLVRADVVIVSRGAGVCAATLYQFRPRGAGGMRSCPWPGKPPGAAQGRVAAAPRRRAPSDGQNRWLVRLIDQWRGPGPAAGEGRSTPAAPASAPVRAGSGRSRRVRGVVDACDGTEEGVWRYGNPTQNLGAAPPRSCQVRPCGEPYEQGSHTRGRALYATAALERARPFRFGRARRRAACTRQHTSRSPRD